MNRPQLKLSKATNRVEQLRDRRQAVQPPEPAQQAEAKPEPAKELWVSPEQLRAARKWMRSLKMPYPWQVGIMDQLIDGKPEDIPERAIHIAVWETCRSEKYLSSFERATHRHGMDGEQIPIAEADQQFANGRLYERGLIEKNRKPSPDLDGND